MKRVLPVVCALSLMIPAALSAQAKFFLGGGPTMPTGDYGSFAATGWMAMGGVQLSFPALPMQVRVEGLYGSNAHDGATTDKTNLYGGMANVVYSFGVGPSPIKPYLVGGLGYLDHHFDAGNTGLSNDDEWKLVFGGGLGLGFGLGPLQAFAEARYLTRDQTNFIPVMVGLKFGGM